MLTNRAEENKMDRDKNTDTFNSNHATYALLEVGYGHYHNDVYYDCIERSLTVNGEVFTH